MRKFKQKASIGKSKQGTEYIMNKITFLSKNRSPNIFSNTRFIIKNFVILPHQNKMVMRIPPLQTRIIKFVKSRSGAGDIKLVTSKCRQIEAIEIN